MPEQPLNAIKTELRRAARVQRRGLADSRRTAFDQRIRETLARELSPGMARRVAAFLTIDGEPDLEPLLRQWQAEGREVALPVLGSSDMHFVHWPLNAALSDRPMGLREPAEGEGWDAAELDVVLCPLVAFDDRGARLGMGGGHYDRALAAVASVQRPLRVGVAYEVQRLEQVPLEPHDIPLHAIVTEAGWFTGRT